MPQEFPPVPEYGDHWEIIEDPWHPDAFPDEFKNQIENTGTRKKVLALIDWCGNVIGTRSIEE